MGQKIDPRGFRLCVNKNWSSKWFANSQNFAGMLKEDIEVRDFLKKKLGLTINDMDVIEANEAFAAQACAVTRGLNADPAKVNPNGSGISLGHPIGATGAVITVKAIHELHRTGGRYALVTMCIGGGQGIAAVFERM